MHIRLGILNLGIGLLFASTALAQNVTFSTTTYPNNLFAGVDPLTPAKIDLNADGLEDFVSVNDPSFQSNCTGSFAVTLSKGNGTYAAPVCYTLPSGNVVGMTTYGTYPYGDSYVMVENDTAEVYIYQSSIDGTLQLKNSVVLPGGTGPIAALDINRDGNVDLVSDVTAPSGAPPSTLYVLFGSADLTFTAGPTTTFTFSGDSAGLLTVGDFDNDSHADILVQGGSTLGAEVLYGDGTGHFTQGPQVGGKLTRYTSYDLNSDGTMDLIGAPFQENPQGTPTYYNYLDVEWGHYNRTLTSQHVALKSCTASDVPPVVADLNGDGINDIAVVEAADCHGSGPYTLEVLLGKGNGAFDSERTAYSSTDWIWPVAVLRANSDTKPDIILAGGQLTNGNQFSNAVQLVALNTSSGNFPTCNPVSTALSRITFCAPTSTTGAESPVKFSFAAENQSAGRDFEIWVDGTKVTDQLTHSFSYYTFADATVPIGSGQHKIDLYSKAWDGWEQFATFPLTVGSDVCPQLTGNVYGINVCSPIRYASASSPVLAFARGRIADGSVVRMEVWVDNVKRYTTFASDTLKTYLTVSPGVHTFTYYLVNTNGQIDSGSSIVTVR